MEVACGEHGEYIQKLVVAVNAGKCNNFLQHTPESNTKSISNDIVKEPLKPATTEPVPNGCPKQSAQATCTTSLLDSAENLPNGEKTGFPTSGWQQFWILLKRTIWITLRDKMLTRMRLVSHFIIGILIGLIYYDIGGDAGKLQSNVGCIFFMTMFTMFTAMMPTILTCKKINPGPESQGNIFYFSSLGDVCFRPRAFKLLVLTQSLLLCKDSS